MVRKIKVKTVKIKPVKIRCDVPRMVPKTPFFNPRRKRR